MCPSQTSSTHPLPPKNCLRLGRGLKLMTGKWRWWNMGPSVISFTRIGVGFVGTSPIWQAVCADYSQSYHINHRRAPSKEEWVPVWASLLTPGVTLDESHNFSEPLFPHLTGGALSLRRANKLMSVSLRDTPLSWGLKRANSFLSVQTAPFSFYIVEMGSKRW